MNISSLDLNLLKVLDALLIEGSTIRAAERLNLSQPAVSAALGRLRLSLGDPLFVRQGTGLVPTDYASALALPLRGLLRDMQVLLDAGRQFDPAKAEQSFKISGSDFFAELLMPALGDLVGATAPGLAVQLVDLVPDNYIDTLERDAVDLALIPSMDYPDWVDHQPVFRAPFVTVARAGNPQLAAAGIADGDPIPMDLFCDMGHVLFSPEGKMKAMGDAALAKLGRQRRVAMTLPMFLGVCRVVSASDFIALLPMQLARQMAPRLDLTIHAAPMPVPVALIEMIWHRRLTASPAHRWLREAIAEILVPLNDGLPPLPGGKQG